MVAHRTPRWTQAEIAVLEEFYPQIGVDCVEYLPGRTWTSVHQKAFKLGLRCEKIFAAPEAKLAGEALEEAIRLREEEGWSFARIGAKFGVSEAGANNAVLVALCPRKGYRPAERDEHGRLLPAGIERLRYALKKGLKGCDIQLRLGLSAGRIAEERRRYNRELKAAGKALLPPPGKGKAYSGIKLTRQQKAEVEALFMQGLGTLKISERTGISKTSCTRIRKRLFTRLKRKGEVLPGCDARGVRHEQVESSRFIPDVLAQALREQLLDRVPVSRAAKILAIGASSAYRIRDQLRAELEARGETLPEAIRAGRNQALRESNWPPEGARQIYAFRATLREHGSFADAKAAWRREQRETRDAEAVRPPSFEEQLARLQRGEIGIASATVRPHLEPTHVPEGLRA